jgi:hypothetical protein
MPSTHHLRWHRLLHATLGQLAAGPVFRHLVDLLQNCLLSLEVPPSEVREALIFALYKVEQRRPRKASFASPDLERFFHKHGGYT